MASEIMRLTYKRGELVRYVSHLDFVKVFERTIRRACIDVGFSQGFNPRMLLVFGNPLPVGYTSDCELLDITFARSYEPGEIVEALNSHLPGDIRILSAVPLEKPYASILQSVSFASYEGTVSGLSEGDDNRLISAFQSNDTIFAMKRTKNGEKSIDIKPMIKNFEALGNIVKLVTVTGQEGNLRPETALAGIASAASVQCEFESIRKTAMY